MTKTTASHTYQLRISLDHSKPEIWRRLRLSSDTSLAALHQILQITMGWDNYHLHEFQLGKKRYGSTEGEVDSRILNEFEYTLGQLLTREGNTLSYTYDFGDNWQHTLELEKITPSSARALAPTCTAGGRACPPEDCGGTHGYARMVKILRKPSHEEHEDILEWLGDDFDPGAFDKGAVNDELQRFARREKFSAQLFGMMESLEGVLGDEALSSEERQCLERHFPQGGMAGDTQPNYDGMHGFLTAIICAPLPVDPFEWLMGLNDAYPVVITQQAEFNVLMSALLKQFNQQALALADGAPELPGQSDLVTTPVGITTTELWCDGFMRGFIFNEEDWYDLEDEEVAEELGSIVAIINALAVRQLDDKTLPQEEFAEKITMAQLFLPRGIASLYDLARSEQYAHLGDDESWPETPWADDDWLDELGHVPAEPASSNKVGRNEPCPCGSGLKYKKCCIDKEVTLH